ncbi:MAG: hypothetical protein IJU72_08355 [Bacteroidales bacterium]|nr:hypothetical protein [Bacteroidales bacterium]
MRRSVRLILIVVVGFLWMSPASAYGQFKRTKFYELFVADQRWHRNPMEMYFGLPITQYMGDIGGAKTASNWLGFKDISFRSIRPGLVGGLNYKFSDRITFNGLAAFGVWSQSDKRSRNERRGHAFNTFGLEISASCQYYLIPIQNIGFFSQLHRHGKRRKTVPLGVYVSLGVGMNVFTVSPNASLKADPRYKNAHLCPALPIAVGVRFEPTQKWALEANLGRRIIFSDKFDGFSTQYSKHNDLYYLLNLSAHYRIVQRGTFGRPKKKM